MISSIIDMITNYDFPASYTSDIFSADDTLTPRDQRNYNDYILCSTLRKANFSYPKLILILSCILLPSVLSSYNNYNIFSICMCRNISTLLFYSLLSVSVWEFPNIISFFHQCFLKLSSLIDLQHDKLSECCDFIAETLHCLLL